MVNAGLQLWVYNAPRRIYSVDNSNADFHVVFCDNQETPLMVIAFPEELCRYIEVFLYCLATNQLDKCSSVNYTRHKPLPYLFLQRQSADKFILSYQSWPTVISLLVKDSAYLYLSSVDLYIVHNILVDSIFDGMSQFLSSASADEFDELFDRVLQDFMENWEPVVVNSQDDEPNTGG